MNSSDRRKWNEYDWEREIRKDEARIHSYLKELERYIDLPNEEDLIMKRIQRNPELVPQQSDWQMGPFIDITDEFDFDDDMFDDDEWKQRKGADIYMMLEKLASQWCIVFSATLAEDAMANGMRIICIYGQLLARASDILDLEEDFPKLRIALCKRLHSALSTLIGEICDVIKLQPELVTQLDTHIAHLQSVRTKILKLLEETRTETD